MEKQILPSAGSLADHIRHIGEHKPRANLFLPSKNGLPQQPFYWLCPKDPINISARLLTRAKKRNHINPVLAS